MTALPSRWTLGGVFCMKCGRLLKREPIFGMGPVCARNALGAKPRKVKREPRGADESTPDLFTLEVDERAIAGAPEFAP